MAYRYHDFYNVQVNLCPRAWDTVEWDGSEWTIEKLDYDNYTEPTAIITKPAQSPGSKPTKAVAIELLKFVRGSRLIDYRYAGKRVDYKNLRTTP